MTNAAADARIVAADKLADAGPASASNLPSPEVSPEPWHYQEEPYGKFSGDEIAFLKKEAESLRARVAELEAECSRLSARNAELCFLIEPIAAIHLWRDTHPGGPDGVDLKLFTPAQIRRARAILAVRQGGAS